MRLNLKVPFAEKDEAKKLGARWDAAKKLWYIEGKEDLAAFARWSPTAHVASSTPAGKDAARTGQRTPTRVLDTSAALEVGRRGVEHTRVCECVPWEVCDKCRATSLPDLS